MPGKNPSEAVDAYVQPLQKSVSLISRGVLIPSERNRPDCVGVLHLPDPIPLNGRNDLLLSFKQQYKILRVKRRLFRVTTLHYGYSIETENGEEIIGYHWHPEGVSPVTFPHLHLGPGAQVIHPDLHSKAHFPTGRVSFEDFVEMLVDSFNVKPSDGGWLGFVRRAKEIFHKYKSW